MTFVVFTFLVTLAVVLASYWLFVVRPETTEKTSMVSRLQGVRDQITNVSVARAPARLSSIPALEAALERRLNLIAPLQQLIVESGVRITVGAFVLTTLVCAAAVGVSLWMFFHILVVSIGFAVVAAFLPLVYLRFKRSKRLQLFEEQFPEAIDLIARALRAGHALTTGLGMVSEEVPAPVGEEFKRLYDEQNFGLSLPEAMRAMARRCPCSTRDFS
jgi:tight adherence protein B